MNIWDFSYRSANFAHFQYDQGEQRGFPMADWLEHSVHVDVDVPVENVWQMWSNLEQMPQWMKWIDSVEVLADDPELSRWKLNTTGLTFSWLSRIVKVVPQQIIQWESVDGLPNRGAIRFYGHKGGGSTVKMTIAYALPAILARLMMSNSFVDRVVSSTLQADLDRFKAMAIRQYGSPASAQNSAQNSPERVGK